MTNKNRHHFSNFLSEVRNKIGYLPENKTYYYVKIWNIICQPCISELPIMKLLPSAINKNILFINISAHSDEAVSNFLKNNNILIDNFVYLNKMNNFMSWIYSELQFPEAICPLHLLFDHNGNILCYYVGAFGNLDQATSFINFINDHEISE